MVPVNSVLSIPSVVFINCIDITTNVIYSIFMVCFFLKYNDSGQLNSVCRKYRRFWIWPNKYDTEARGHHCVAPKY